MTERSVKVEVRGLRELGSAFNKLDREAAAELKHELTGAAQEVVGLVQSRVEKLTGAAAGSVKAKGSTRGASIAFGGTAAPHYPWLDFGGKVGRGDSIERPFIQGGRYVYPAIAERSDATNEAIDGAVKRAAQRAGFDTQERP